MEKENCIFCKIINKELPCHKIYEDEKLLGFLEINPVAKGHNLLIPKEHHIWIQETPDEILKEFSIAIKKIVKSMQKSLKCHHVEIIIDGVKVSHFHAHLIPRFVNDGLPEFKTIKYDNEDEKKVITQKITSVL